MNYVPFALHPVELAAGLIVVLLSGGHVTRGVRMTRLAAVLSWWVVTLWPIGDIAATHSLSVATAQRLVIMLGVAAHRVCIDHGSRHATNRR